MTEQKNLFTTSIGILSRSFAQEYMIRTAPNLNLQKAKHEKHTENPNRTRTCINSVWNAPAWSRHGANSLDYDSDTGPVLPDLDRGWSVLYQWLALMCCHVHGHDRTLFPVLYIIRTEDNKTLLPHIDRSRFRRRKNAKEVMSLCLVSQLRH